ncbi:MAG TPA: polysaccharide deacetylase family protein, partial [Burkholderiales bacterium]|nr:polysaccharide deacetylase family protein [Burkholderiales bacterium]
MLNRVLRYAGDFLSAIGEGGKLIILVYHRTPREPDPMLPEVIEAAVFEEQVCLLARAFNVLPLGDACARLAAGKLPARSVCITFDDGYADNETVAAPILKRYGVSATFFVSTGYTRGGIMFNDAIIEAVRRAPADTYDLSPLGLGPYTVSGIQSRRKLISALIARLMYRSAGDRSDQVEKLAGLLRTEPPRDLMMTHAQIANLHAGGMEIGAHTVHHPILSLLDREHARAEILEGKRELERITQAPVRLFAYPNGKPGIDYGPRDTALVKEAGFAAAVSTAVGVAARDSDLFQLPRLGLWDRQPRRLGARL